MLFLGQPFNLCGRQEQSFSRELLEGSWKNNPAGVGAASGGRVSEQFCDDYRPVVLSKGLP